MLSNLDSVLTMGHNFYIYLNPATNKLVFLPWDMDLSFAGFPMGGSPDQQMDLSLLHPYVGQNKLIDRLLAIPAVNEQYRKILKDLATTVFSKEKLLADIEAIEKATKEVREKETKAAGNRKENSGGFGFGPGRRHVRPVAGLEDVRREADGVDRGAAVRREQGLHANRPRQEGRRRTARRRRDIRRTARRARRTHVPRPPIGDVLPAFLQEMVGVTEQQKRQLADVQKEVDARLDRILTAEQKAHLKRMREGGPVRIIGGPGGPPPEAAR